MSLIQIELSECELFYDWRHSPKKLINIYKISILYAITHPPAKNGINFLSMNRFSHREELQRNAEMVSKFYIEVLGSLTEKLIKENRYRKTLSEDDILQLQKVAKEKMGFRDKENSGPGQLFHSFLLKRQSTKDQAQLHVIAHQGETTPMIKIHPKEQLNETAVKTQHSKSLADHQEEEEYVDDLAGFEYSHQEKPEVKIESTPHKDNLKQAKEEEGEGERERERSDDESESKDYTSVIQEMIGTAILGTFSSFHIKRKPKQQKIYVELQNVFMKYSNGAGENFHGKVSCELTKIEKEDIKELRK